VVKVFALKETPAKSVIEAIERLRKQGKTKIELRAMALDDRTNSLLVQGTQDELVFIGAIIAELDAAAAKPRQREQDQNQLDQRLHALDIREAEINLKAAQTKHDRLQELSKAGAATVSQQEVLAAATELEKAQVMVEQVKARGDRLKSQQLEVRLAEAMLRAAQVHLERVSILVDSGQASTTELDVGRFEVEKAEVALERAKARLEAVQAGKQRER
jgi:multidrug resistance efflux pump